jgi:RNA polymerase alpha subunit/sigma-70-like protein
VTSDPKEFAANVEQTMAEAVALPSDCVAALSAAGYRNFFTFLQLTSFLQDVAPNQLELSVRSRNCLVAAEITSLRELLLLTKGKLLRLGNMGVKSLLNVGAALQAFTDSPMFRESLGSFLENRQSVLLPRERAFERETASAVEMLGLQVANGWGAPPNIEGDLDAPVLVLDLPARAVSLMHALSVGTVRDLLRIPPKRLLSELNCGRKTLSEIQARLSHYLSHGVDHDSSITGFKSFVEQQLSRLDDRSRSILRDRHGLWDDICETLQEIGDKFNLTRERIRQIEVKAKRRLRNTAAIEFKRFVQRKLMSHFGNDEHSGVISDSALPRLFADDCTEEEATVGIEFIIDLLGSNEKLFGPFMSRPEPGIYAAGLHIHTLYLTAVERIRSILTSKRTALKIDEVLSSATAGFENADLFFRKVMEVSPSFRVINNRFVVCSDWPLYSTKTTSALCRVALSVSGKPLHFREIAARIVQLNPDMSSVNIRTVHNELVKRSDLFVNVGEGTYALLEWGLKRPPYLKDALIRILSESSYPVQYWYIEQKMRTISAYKPTSIRMTLDLNPKIFKKYDGDQYSLVAGHRTSG